MNLKGERILIRAIERGDLSLLQRWFNDEQAVAQLGDLHMPSSLLQQERWYERIQADTENARWMVQDENGGAIGYTGLWHLNWRCRRAEHGLLLGEAESRGRGYGREIVRTCVRYAFDVLGLHRVESRILEENTASIRLYEQCGFVREGLLRDDDFRDGQFVNRVVLGLLAGETDPGSQN
ncbi:MAG: GNAT family N-acetyltransferase [Kiritimatiellae bacterium]|nr:GNAT family N-acetyltransferase [Kiritimatiellia bacterium]